MPRQLKPCGTVAAYVRHKKAGEKPCDLCRLHINERERQKNARKRAHRDLGRQVDQIIHEIIESRWGHWGWKGNYDREWNETQRIWWHFKPQRRDPYPQYKWEKQAVRDHIVPMQDVLKQLFPYNCEKPKPCKCCDGTGIRRG